MAPSSSSSVSPEEDLEELRKLERTMRRNRATLHDAEEHWNIREESTKLRLKELKEVALSALDPSAGVHNTGKRKHEEMEAYPVDAGVVVVPNDLVLGARKITERFNEIIHYSEHFSLSENDGERRLAPDLCTLRHTSSVVFDKSIVGREQDRDKIIDKLLSRKGENAVNPVSVMPIVGMGGLGRTTLAQLVYNSQRVRQSFENRAWVFVSENFDIKTMTRNIITSITEPGQQCMHSELADLQRKLATVMNGQRVFLVLDDVWNERRDCWELFCAPMTAAKVCQIIATTRSEAVARLIQTMPFYPLNCLSFDESWSLFCKAVLTAEQESDDIPTNLIKIGKSIVTKCKGLPLAIKTLGSMLRYENDQRRWMNVLESELWDLKEPRDDILAALELSYKHMPVQLRRCFLCLSLFPKDYKIYASEVSRLWKLLDLLDSDGSDNEFV
ncbi:putative disease resistance protein RGA3 [Miscanthus floridulus]|uniref:putative disease resistance protein RGA3 n=1 Tax=Miscanthus floridulus TaxID=154761 RepID=UPI0034586699